MYLICETPWAHHLTRFQLNMLNLHQPLRTLSKYHHYSLSYCTCQIWNTMCTPTKHGFSSTCWVWTKTWKKWLIKRLLCATPARRYATTARRPHEWTLSPWPRKPMMPEKSSLLAVKWANSKSRQLHITSAQADPLAGTCLVASRFASQSSQLFHHIFVSRNCRTPWAHHINFENVKHRHCKKYLFVMHSRMRTPLRVDFTQDEST